MLITILDEKRLHDQAQSDAFIATFEPMCCNKDINVEFDIVMKVMSQRL